MTRTITMGDTGIFTVSEDPDDTIAMALLIATAPQHIDQVDSALASDGLGFDIETFGYISRLEDRSELVPPFDEDPMLDPATQELWILLRDRDWQHPHTGRFVIPGDELRALVREAIALRRNAGIA